MQEEKEKIKQQHIERYKKAIIETIKNNTNSLIDDDIMSLRKPYKGRKPTVLFITKYSLLNKKNNQEVFRLIPYTKVLKTSKNIKDLINNKDEEIEANFSNYNNDTDDTEIITSDETKVEHTVIPIEELDLSLPISNIEDYL